MSGVIIDIGTGDGKFVYELAKTHPDRFIVGIDPQQKGLETLSAKIYKKPAKGGIPNALFVLAHVEDLPQELNSIANQVFINFPWSSLLKGVVLVEEKTWGSINRVCQSGAFVDIVFGYHHDIESRTVDALELPDINLDYLREIFAPKLLEVGFEVIKMCEVTPAELKNFPSTWAKKLRFGRERSYFFIRVKKR